MINSEKERVLDCFKDDAKFMIDSLFEAKLFKDEISRDTMSAAEAHLEYCLRSKLDLYIRSLELTKKAEKEMERIRMSREEKDKQ